MAKQNNKVKQGFTIIEVVLVLAIAGLIFLMVFVALPALQRSQRDTQRRNDMSRVDTSLVQYQTNNVSAGDSTAALPQGPSFWEACKDGSYTASCTTNDGENNSNDEAEAQKFIQRYMNSGTDSAKNTFEDPDGVFYSLYITENFDGGGTVTTSKGGAKLEETSKGYTIGTDFADRIIYILPGAKCDGEYAVKDTKRHFAIMYRLEGAGVYCIDDQ